MTWETPGWDEEVSMTDGRWWSATEKLSGIPTPPPPSMGIRESGRTALGRWAEGVKNRTGLSSEESIVEVKPNAFTAKEARLYFELGAMGLSWQEAITVVERAEREGVVASGRLIRFVYKGHEFTLKAERELMKGSGWSDWTYTLTDRGERAELQFYMLPDE
jgi:hypothetical protein